ncbi:ABC transporter substrate-binding protein [Reinekea sp. G2M2-21]|uniref:substrate-binding periplasmic protein n=1 Tax=Reinekea sp. G2M2-21 TaxID=2788942 RepID=UPI0018AC1CF5|nr:transporter substrate-binding domain-containing protein [Reinekea sp. G2M2-21]
MQYSIAKKIALGLLLVASTFTFADQIKVANNDWVPYNTSDGKGLVDQIVKEAFALVGHDVTYVVFPWKRAYESVKAGETDITYPWSYTDERNNEIIFNSTALIVNRSIFWYKKGTNFSWTDYGDLSKYSIGGMIGYSDTDLLEGNGVTIQLVKDELTNLKKLLAGRIDAFAMNEVVGTQIIKQNLSSEEQAQLVTFQDKPLVETNMHAVFSNNDRGKKLAADFEKGLKMLVDSGRYEEILFSGN